MWNIGALVISVEQVVVIVDTIVLCALLFVMFRFTRIGVAMQAAE